MMYLQKLELGGATTLREARDSGDCAPRVNRISSCAPARLLKVATWWCPCDCRFQCMGDMANFSSIVGYINSMICVLKKADWDPFFRSFFFIQRCLVAGVYF